MDETTSRICPWCSAEIPATSPACPKCGALVEGAKAIDLPVVTLFDPEAALPEDGPRPADLNTVGWHTATTEPSPAEPIAAEPVAAEPIAAEPIAAEPIAAEPIAAEAEPTPQAIEPHDEPIAAEPIEAEPITAEPIAPEAVEPIEPEPIEPEPIAAGPIAPEVIEPPAEPVRLEMRKIELESEIENAGRAVMNPEGDVSIIVPAPSVEAIEAYEAGLLDAEGPAGETDLAENAQPWEDPELEQRLALWRQQNPDKA
jgi:hypothetical protein